MILKLLLNTQNYIKNVYKNVEEYNAGKKRKVLIICDDMIADMIIYQRQKTENFAHFAFIAHTIAQKMQFSIKDFFSKVTKSAVSCQFGHIY